MYSNYMNLYLKMRKQAITQGIPEWALLHADRCVDKAAWCRKRASGRKYGNRYARALNELMAGIETLRSYLFRSAYLERLNTPNLQEVMDAKQQSRESQRAKRNKRAGSCTAGADPGYQSAGGQQSAGD